MDRSQLLNDAEQAMRLVLDGRQSSLWSAMPGIVQSVDFTKMTCSVQPSIQGTVENEDGTSQSVNLPLLTDVPIVFPSAGGFTLTLPLAVNDEVLVVFASRCIDAWWQSGGIQRPMETRMHDLSDGFAIPGPHSQPRVLSGISSTGAQLRNNAGTSYIEIAADGKIKLIAPAEIDITAPLVKVTGNLTVSGTIVATGALTGASIATSGAGGAVIAGSLSAASVTAGGIPLATHKHTGVTTGGGTSGGPTP
jgi:hypothetical protein